MKKSVICLLGLVLFLLSCTVFATNWAFVGKDPLGNCYIDRDSIVNDGNNIIFWSLDVYDQPMFGNAKEMRKCEVELTGQRQLQTLEFYIYDSNGNETYQDTKPVKSLTVVDMGSILDKEIDTALKYDKERQDSGQKPDISQAPQN